MQTSISKSLLSNANDVEDKSTMRLVNIYYCYALTLILNYLKHRITNLNVFLTDIVSFE